MIGYAVYQNNVGIKYFNYLFQVKDYIGNQIIENQSTRFDFTVLKCAGTMDVSEILNMKIG